MPKRKRATAKRGFRKRRRGYGRRVYRRGGKKLSKVTTFTMRSLGSSFPDRYRCRLRFVSPGINYTSGGPVNYNAIFYGNSVFDPLGASGTRQPLGYDQISNMYRYYRVFGSTCTVTLFTSTTTVAGTRIATVTPQTSASPLASTYEYADQPFTKRGYLTAYNAPGRVRNYMSTKRIWGEKNITDDNFYGRTDTGTSPNDLWYWHISVNNADASAMATGDYMEVTITYYVEFTTLTLLNQS